MKWTLIFFTILALLSPQLSLAQSVKTTKKVSRKTKTRNLLSQKYYDATAQYIMWQENIDASGTGISGSGRFQFVGYQFGANLNKPIWGIRWLRQYSSQLTLGTVKGTGESLTFTDEFKNQTWLAASASAGLIYRTSAASEIGVYLPLSVRYINWTYADGAVIELDKQTSFSAGLGFQYIQRFSRKSSLIVTVAHQYVWEATQWSLGYQYSFR
jgi:hypothetical protein